MYENSKRQTANNKHQFEMIFYSHLSIAPVTHYRRLGRVQDPFRSIAHIAYIYNIIIIILFIK